MKQDLLREVAAAVAEFQDAADLVDEAASAYLGINRTDQRCLGVLFARGAVSAGQLAQAVALSPGAATAAVDRLEKAGYVQRVRDPEDRRGVLVEMTGRARELITQVYSPVGEEGMARLEQYSEDELRLLRDFLKAGYELQVRHAASIREMRRGAGQESEE